MMKEFKVKRKHEKLFDLLRQILGVVAIIVGLLGLVFPILPGWIFIFIGLELLGIQIVFVERIKEFVKEKLSKEKKKKE